VANTPHPNARRVSKAGAGGDVTATWFVECALATRLLFSLEQEQENLADFFITKFSL